MLQVLELPKFSLLAPLVRKIWTSAEKIDILKRVAHDTFCQPRIEIDKIKKIIVSITLRIRSITLHGNNSYKFHINTALKVLVWKYHMEFHFLIE